MKNAEKLEELAQQAKPALRHVELVKMAEKAGRRQQVRRLVRQVLLPRQGKRRQYTRSEAKAATALAEYYMLAGKTAFEQLVSRARLQNFNELVPKSHRGLDSQPISETSDTFTKLALDVGRVEASDYLWDLLSDGFAWFIHDMTSQLPEHESPILVVVRPNQERHPGSSDLVVNLKRLFRILGWNRAKRTRRQFIIDVFSSTLEYSEPNLKSVYWRMRAGMRVVRDYLDPEDELATAFEVEAIIVALRLGCVFGIREHMLLTPSQPAEDPAQELVPAVKVLRNALYSEAALQQELRFARNAQGLSDDAITALNAMITPTNDEGTNTP